MYVCMYIWINSESMCSVEVFLSLEEHFMKVVCCVKLSNLCPKVFVECHSFVFSGTICTIQSLFCKGYLSSSSYNHKKDWVFVHHARLLLICVFCFLIYVLLEGTDVNSVGHQPVLCMCKVDVSGYAKVCATLA